MSMCRKCDVCGAHGTTEDYQYITVNAENSTGSVGKLVKRVEVCPECFESIDALLVPTTTDDATTDDTTEDATEESAGE